MLKSDYLLNLNEKQQEAVLHLDGPLLIVAGAGSGKTKVLTSRIAHIINKVNINPPNIAALFFESLYIASDHKELLLFMIRL